MTPLHVPAVSLQAALLVSLLLAAVFAGCVDQDEGDCVNGVCTQTAKPGDAFLTNATRPSADYPRCSGGFLGLDVPVSLLDGHLPAEFEPFSSVPELASLRILAVDCPRATIGQIVSEPLRFVLTAVAAAPIEDGWQDIGIPSQYVFEAFVDDEAAAAALGSWGLPATTASIAIEPSGVGMMRADAWSVSTPSVSYEFSFSMLDGTGGGFSGPFAFWSGAGTYHRLDSNYTTTNTELAGLGASEVIMSENTRLADIIGTDRAPFNHQAYQAYTDEWRPHPFTFSLD